MCLIDDATLLTDDSNLVDEWGLRMFLKSHIYNWFKLLGGYKTLMKATLTVLSSLPLTRLFVELKTTELTAAL